MKEENFSHHVEGESKETRGEKFRQIPLGDIVEQKDSENPKERAEAVIAQAILDLGSIQTVMAQEKYGGKPDYDKKTQDVIEESKESLKKFLEIIGEPIPDNLEGVKELKDRLMHSEEIFDKVLQEVR